MSSPPPARTPARPLTLTAHAKDLGGGFTVRRLLPAAACRAVGPFVFFDHFGPVAQRPDDDHDVRPHPHIGLATVTYLYEGAWTHRDSTGIVQDIEPGAVNWMNAGRGVVHSERMPERLRGTVQRKHGLQLWCALPEADEEMAPTFQHVPAAQIPALEAGGARVRVLVGEAFGVRSPVLTRSPTLYLDIALQGGDALPLPPAAERAVYALDDGCTLDGEPLRAHTLRVLAPGDEPLLAADRATRAVLIGGEPLGPRHMWWNFVSSRSQRIREAAEDWLRYPAAGFDPVPGETTFIPLPEKRPLG